MDVVNFDALKAQGRILDLANVDPEEDYLIIGKYTNKYTTDNFKYTKYPIYAIKAGDVIGVQSVTGLDTDNTDPYNPVVNIAVDGITITGQGTPASPLVAVDPRPYKVYTALLNQTGISAPVATVLENTIGNIVWTRDDVGIYIGTLLNSFTINKTIVFLNLGSGNVCIINSLPGSADYVVINANGPDFPNDPIDVQGLMQIEIRVYN
jgi:hypothetical protein